MKAARPKWDEIINMFMDKVGDQERQLEGLDRLLNKWRLDKDLPKTRDKAMADLEECFGVTIKQQL